MNRTLPVHRPKHGELRTVLTGDLIAQVWGVGATFLSTPDGRQVIIPE